MTHSDRLFIDRMAIIGVGMIGGSLALALKKAGVVKHIIGVGRSPENLGKALKLGVIDEIQSDICLAVENADVVVLATPVNTIMRQFEMLVDCIRPDTIISDVGSVKSGIVQSAKRALGDKFMQFVPAHPIAGKEKSGIMAASDDLYEDHTVILTPTEETSTAAVGLIQSMWQITGATVKKMDMDEHDKVLSVTSHLPHVLAYVMMDFLATSSNRDKCYEMAAGGFYDFTRTASSDPEMWRDICLMNSAHLARHVSDYIAKLEKVRSLIQHKQAQSLEDLFATSKQARSLVTEKRKPKKHH